MIEGIGSLEPGHVTSTLAGTKVDQVEQLARRGDLQKASQEFESYFVSYLLKVMRETVPQGELTANKMGEDIASRMNQRVQTLVIVQFRKIT
jgi:Rod binding domain-containing protein